MTRQSSPTSGLQQQCSGFLLAAKRKESLHMNPGPTSFRQAVISKRQVAVSIKPHLAAVTAVNTQRPRMAYIGAVNLRRVPPANGRMTGSKPLG